MEWESGYRAFVGRSFKLTTGRREKSSATMVITADGQCAVRAESLAPAKVQPKFSTHHGAYSRERERLISAGILVPFTAETLRFAREHVFSSPTAASAVIRGGPGSLAYWKAADGKTLQDMWRALVDGEAEAE